jgi:hypothetical protein
MKQLEIALELNLKQQYEAAIYAYEDALKEVEVNDVSIYIELSFLYWECACDFSWADYYNIPMSLRRIAMDRADDIIKIAKIKFPNCGDLYFWDKYFMYRLCGYPLSELDVLDIIKKHETSIIPFFFLYICYDITNNKYQKERDYLLGICKEQMTAKNIEILSLIE